MKTIIGKDKNDLGRLAADDAAARICAAIAANGEARVVFASAASQFEFIEALLTHKEIDWSKVCGFHLDEYVGLPADHPASFRRFLRERLLAKLPCPVKGFTFVGGHPMAGSQFSGFKYSRANLYHGAPMVLVPPRYDDIELLQRVKDALAPCGFGMYSVTSAEDHDKMIAFTSQMPHVLSNAFIKSPTARNHKGFSAGSYKDLTRVAWLNAPMWSELFLENRENLLFELNTYLDNLTAYRDALENRDEKTLTALLEEGKKAKEEVDG